MNFMSSTIALRFLHIAALLAPFTAAGCQDRACIQWSEAEGACPAQSEALVFMSQPFCGGNVRSVDSEGDYDEGACCYDVTERSNSSGDVIPCASGPVGAGAVGGAVTASGSFASTVTGSSTGVGGGGTGCELNGLPCSPACDAADMAPSGGSCVPIGGDIQCNPVTNEGCDSAAGEACDLTQSGFTCYPAPNIENICGACGGQGESFCAAGLTCIGTCARFCCDDSDCGTGFCFKDPFAEIASVGVCVLGDGTGGSGGMGGAGGEGGSGGSGGMSAGGAGGQ
jgi:hypothetical protein